MTVSSTTNKLTYSGDGSTVEFTTPYFTADDDLLVILADATGEETTLALTTDYTVTGSGVVTGGTLTMVAAPASGETLAIKTDPDITQEVDYVENDSFPAETHEGALDKLTLICQSIAETAGRYISFRTTAAVSDVKVPAPEAGKLLGWNEAEDDLENKDLTGTGTISIPVPILSGGTGATTASAALTNLTFSTFVKSTITASNASAYRDVIGVTIGEDVQAYDADIVSAPSGVLPALDASSLTSVPGDVVTTEGDVIIGNSSGNPIRLPIGSASQILKSDGTTVSWEDLVDVGMWEYVSTEDISGTNAVDFTDLSASYDYRVVFDGVAPVATSTSALVALVGYGATPTWLSTSYSTAYETYTDTDGYAYTSYDGGSSIVLSGLLYSATTFCTGDITLVNIPSTKGYPTIDFTANALVGGATSADFSIKKGKAMVFSTNALTGIRFISNTGNFTSGEFHLYRRLRR